MTALTSKKPLRQVADVRELLSNLDARNQLAAVAAQHMNPERMMRVVANAIRTTPQLQECSPLSMLGALMECAALGLEPNTRLGHAYLVPFKNNKSKSTDVQLIIGYKGFLDIARRSRMVAGIHADVVYSDDPVWSYEYGSEMHLRHRPGPRKGEKLAAYCHVTLTDGQAFVVLPWEAVIARRDASQAWRRAVRNGEEKQAIWHLHEDRMAAKTAVRALANAGEMPLSIDFERAIESDDARMDYAGYALNPSEGLMHAAEDDGDVIEHESADKAPEEKPEEEKPKSKPAAKSSSKAKSDPPSERQSAPQSGKSKATPKRAAKSKEADEASTERQDERDSSESSEPDVDPPYAALAERISGELEEAPDGDEVDAILDMYEPSLDEMKEAAPDEHARVMKAAADRREALGGD